MSPVQSAERVASEAEAARSDADAIRDAVEGCQGTWASPQVNELELAHKGTRIPGLDCSAPKAFLSTCERLCSVIISSVLASQYPTSTSGEGTSHT